MRRIQIKIGDMIQLNRLDHDVDLLGYLKGEIDQRYTSVKITPINEKDELLNAPLLLAGFKTEIKRIVEENEMKVAYTSHLRIELSAAVKSKEIRKLPELGSTPGKDLSNYSYLIEKLKDVHHNFCFGLIPSTEKNSLQLDYLSSFFLLHWKERAVAAKSNTESIEEIFASSWKIAFARQNFMIKENGFLHQLDQDQKYVINLRLGFLSEAKKRGVDKKTRIGYSMSDFWLSRAKIHGEMAKCFCTIIISIRDIEYSPVNLAIEGKYYFLIKKIDKRSLPKQIITTSPWQEVEFISMVENLMSKDVC